MYIQSCQSSWWRSYQWGRRIPLVLRPRRRRKLTPVQSGLLIQWFLFALARLSDLFPSLQRPDRDPTYLHYICGSDPDFQP